MGKALLMSGGDTLREFLRRAGYRPRQLAHAVNARLERRGLERNRIDPSTPYHWLRHGYRPYEPVPQIVAELVEERLGQRITVGMLWPGREQSDDGIREADDGLAGPWSGDGTLRMLDDLAGLGEVERREYRPVAGPPLINSALDGLALAPAQGAGRLSAPSPISAALRTERVLPPMMDLLSGHIAALRRLDDRQGGGALSLRYVTNELQGVLDLVRSSSYAMDVGRRLFTVVANLAQLAGWMHFDAGEAGCAQRYFLLGLRAARAAEDPACAANILGMLAYQAAHSGQAPEAVRLAEAAVRAAQPLDVTTRARIAGRLATAHASAGDVYGFRAASESARELWDRRGAEAGPAFLYYFTAEQLAAESGQALVDLARLNPGRKEALLAEATTLLRPLSTVSLQVDFQRSALLHGCYLAEAHLELGDLAGATGAVRSALPRAAGVQSGRCAARLHGLRRALTLRKRNKAVAAILPELERAL
jgi:hypothetical protein